MVLPPPAPVVVRALLMVWALQRPPPLTPSPSRVRTPRAAPPPGVAMRVARLWRMELERAAVVRRALPRETDMILRTLD